MDQNQAVVGLRSQQRLEKRSRLREAARAVFKAKGYKQATTREIADVARIAHATLFRYARDKRELLLLIVNDDLDALSLDAADYPGDGIQEALVQFYRPRFGYFAECPEISRPFVAESFNFMNADQADVGPEALRNRARRTDLVTALTALIALYGSKDHNVAVRVAQLVHAIYLSTVRAWLEQDDPAPDQGLQQLRSLFAMAGTGFEAEMR